MKFHSGWAATTLFFTALFCVSTVPAGAATIQTFSINFTGYKYYYGDSGAVSVAGSGSFSVNLGSSYCLETEPGGCDPGSFFYPSFITINNLVSGFSVDIAEQHYVLYSPTAWWSAGSQAPGYLAYDQYTGSPVAVYNQWFAGDPFYGYRQFVMDFAVAHANSGNGTWMEIVDASYDPAGQGYTASGAWSATANFAVASVPAAAWLFGSGLLGLIGVARRKAA
jgi:hypothetical protein